MRETRLFWLLMVRVLIALNVDVNALVVAIATIALRVISAMYIAVERLNSFTVVRLNFTERTSLNFFVILSNQG